MTRRILLVGRATGPTGFARVMRRLADGFAGRGLETWVCATDDGPFAAAAWRLLPCRNPDDVTRAAELPELCARLRPSQVVIMNNEGPVMATVGRLAGAARGAPLFAYVPSEGRIEFPGGLRGLMRHATLVLYTRTAVRLLEAATSPLDARDEVGIVGHGVDTETFRPLSTESRRRARARLFGPHFAPDLAAERTERGLFVLNANRNDRRKRLDLTFAAFARFARDRPHAYLVMHSARRSHAYDLEHLARAVGLGERIIFTHGGRGPPDADDHELNEIYNACDIGLNTSSFEGWGLIAFEHGATGAPQILTEDETMREIWGDNALLVGNGRSAGARSFEEALRRLADPAARGVMGERARAHAGAARNGWPAVIDRWLELFARQRPQVGGPAAFERTVEAIPAPSSATH